MGKLQSKQKRNISRYRIDGDAGHCSVTQVVQQYSPAHNDAVTSLASLTSDNCVSGGKDKTVVIYDWKSGCVQQKFMGHESDVTKARDGFHLFFQLWDLRQTKHKVCEYKGHLQTTAACIFLPNATSSFPLVATSGHDCTVKIWNRDTAVCVSSLYLDGAGPLTSLASSDAANLLCGSFNTGIHQLRVNLSNSCSLSEVARF
ncbi:WD repeat-containing protein 31 [Rhincodon typus]|uniref:WD repeat-containing protein 31 n=1 Tax=Rhincodon typus TaxID=259920 RepID=UPI0020306E81|nr:WD repeat-containing protein 31 [Rhincodon typus]